MELQKKELEELKKNKKKASEDVIRAQVEKMWDLYDQDKSGKLDKKEVLRFMNEVLTTVKSPIATK
jgi:Ca2+-binding EF-hand superfamily protein